MRKISTKWYTKYPVKCSSILNYVLTFGTKQQMKNLICIFFILYFTTSSCFALNIIHGKVKKNDSLNKNSHPVLPDSGNIFSIKKVIALNDFISISSPMTMAIEPQIGTEFVLNQTFNIDFLASYFYTFDGIISRFSANTGNQETINESGTTKLHLAGITIQPKVRLGLSKETYLSIGLTHYFTLLKNYEASYTTEPFHNSFYMYYYTSGVDYSVKYSDGFSSFNIAYFTGIKLSKNESMLFNIGIKNIFGKIITTTKTTESWDYYNNPSQSFTRSLYSQSNKNFSMLLFHVGLAFVL